MQRAPAAISSAAGHCRHRRIRFDPEMAARGPGQGLKMPFPDGY
jgi:hypothetical protein